MILIDADIIAYRAAFAAQKTGYYLVSKDNRTKDMGDTYTKTQLFKRIAEAGLEHHIEPYTRVEGEQSALDAVKHLMDTILQEFVGEKSLSFLTGSEITFRHDIAATHGPKGFGYKAGRNEKPVYLGSTRKYIIDNYNTKVVYGIEADDAIGISATRLGADTSTIVSIDKDLCQIYGTHYNPFTKESKSIKEAFISLSDNRKKIIAGGHMQLCSLMLEGDTVDNIPGVPGYGPVRAYELLIKLEGKTELEVLDKVYEVYQSAFGDEAEERFYEIGDLCYILRSNRDERFRCIYKR